MMGEAERSTVMGEYDFRSFLRSQLKKSLESDNQGPEAPTLSPIHGFATAISNAYSGWSPMSLTWSRGPGFSGPTECVIGDKCFSGIR
jgi:hypothetical protein